VSKILDDRKPGPFAAGQASVDTARQARISTAKNATSDSALIARIPVRENRKNQGEVKMTNKTATKKRTSKTNDWDWEDFRPEWANEGIERISNELEKWNDKLQRRSARFRKDSQKRIEKGVKQVQDELRKVPGVKRAEELRVEIESRLEKNIDAGVDRVYTRLNLVRLDEVKKLERKIGQLNKKLRALEKKWAA